MRLLAQVPSHKSLLCAPAGKGLPIGSLTSQFFANVFLNELDQFVKHRLRIKAYVRYVDDFVLLADSPSQLMQWRQSIECFLHTHLGLRLHPHKQVLQRCNQGIDFLGNVIHPTHRYARQRIVKALRRRLAQFEAVLTSGQLTPGVMSGSWERWLDQHQVCRAPGIPTTALLQRMLSTINSYYGVLKHANTYRLRQHIYHRELGNLRRYFRPDGPHYQHLRIRKIWLLPT